MTILQIEHKVPNYDGWKKAFDSDPIDRKKSGVKGYRVYRTNDDPDYVVVDLEFDNVENAQTTLAALKKSVEQSRRNGDGQPKIKNP